MAKTLIGLYDTLTDAEQVVQDLIHHGFARSDIRLVTERTTHAVGRTADQPSASEDLVSSGGTALVEELTDCGVPMEEAAAYTEGVRRGGTLVIVDAHDDWAERGLEIMQRLQVADIDERMAQWRQEGWTHTSSSAAATGSSEQSRARPRGVEPGEATIPVVEEELSVGKREVERGRVRIHTRVEERPVEESVQLREEKVTVERRPVDRPATEADLRTGKDETIEVTETVEEAVVSKRARVVEEVVVHKEVTEHAETVRGTVRHTEVDVDREGPSRGTAVPGFETYAVAFRQHHTTAFAGSGAAYTDYEPAYRYGYDLGTNARYHGRDWAALEAEARRDWDARQPGTWERFKEAIRHGWHTVRTRS
jgi:uncharacterized protein (TIGR02271 family)